MTDQRVKIEGWEKPASVSVPKKPMIIRSPILEQLLEELKKFIEEDLKEYRLPVKQEGWTDQPLLRPVEVYQMVMPEPDEEHEKIPYILLQMLNGRDKRGDDRRIKSVVNIRIVIEIFNRDNLEGRFQIIHIIETLRRDLWRAGTIGTAFELEGMEFLIYPDDTEWYHAGEVSTNWIIPSEERDDVSDFLHGLK